MSFLSHIPTDPFICLIKVRLLLLLFVSTLPLAVAVQPIHFKNTTNIWNRNSKSIPKVPNSRTSDLSTSNGPVLVPASKILLARRSSTSQLRYPEAHGDKETQAIQSNEPLDRKPVKSIPKNYCDLRGNEELERFHQLLLKDSESKTEGNGKGTLFRNVWNPK